VATAAGNHCSRRNAILPCGFLFSGWFLHCWKVTTEEQLAAHEEEGEVLYFAVLLCAPSSSLWYGNFCI